MNLIRRYVIIIIAVAAVALLLILRSTGDGHFRYDAKKHASRSFDGKNMISSAALGSLPGDPLLLLLGNDPLLLNGYSGKSLRLSPDSVMSEKYLRQIRKHKGPVVLYSADNSVSSRVWMVLAQTGHSDIYICSSDSTGVKK